MGYIRDDGAQRASSAFIRQSMNAPLLTREDEFSYAKAWRDEQDEAALHKLIEAYNRLVVSTASKFRHYGLPMSDLIQEGVVGLLQAANRFETERDVRFSTYASWWIKSSMQDFVLRNWSIVRTGTTAAQKSLFFNLRRLRSQIEDFSGDSLGEEGRQTVAETLGVSLRDVGLMEGRLAANDQSLNEFIGEEGQTERLSLIPDQRPNPEAVTIEHHDGDARRVWLIEAMTTLSDREEIIIRERRLKDEGVTLEQLGKRFGVSKERVRQLEHRALKKLKAQLRAHVHHPKDLLLEQ
jgi:RNA polymerase sigma-32 factor